MDIDDVSTVQLYIPADDLGVEVGGGRIITVDRNIAIRGKDGAV